VTRKVPVDNTNLPFRPEFAPALGSHEINKIIKQTNSALKHLSAQVQEQMCDIELRQYQQLNTEAKRQPTKTIFRAGGKMITSRGSLLAIRHCKVTRALTRTTPLCYIDQPVTFKGRTLFRESNSWILMSSSDQVPCTPGQEPIHNINSVFKAQKSEEVFAKAWGVGGGSSHLTKIYSDGKNIFQSAN
jgi:hypothetical protein